MYPLLLPENNEERPADELLCANWKSVPFLVQGINALLNCYGVHFIKYLILPIVLAPPF